MSDTSGSPSDPRACHGSSATPDAPADCEGGVPGPVPWTVPFAVAVFAVAFALTILLIAVASVFVPETYAAPASLFAFNIGLALATVIAVAVRHPGQAGRLFGRAPTLRDVAAGVGYGVAASLLINVVLVLGISLIAEEFGIELPQTQESLREAVTDTATGPYVIVAVVTLAPFAEELFFRGLLFQAVARRLSTRLAMVVSGAAFAAVHLQGSVTGSLLVIVGILPLGTALAWAFSRRGTLLVAMAMHATFNLVSSVGLVVLS